MHVTTIDQDLAKNVFQVHNIDDHREMVLSQSIILFPSMSDFVINVSKSYRQDPTKMSIDFKGSHYPKDVILYAVFFYVRYGVSYRDLEEIMAERRVEIDHATLNRWVVKFSPSIAANAQARKKPTAISWRMPSRDIALQCPVR